MGKLHTHYDNLKVARLAPQEVIRAAYKALSQKYHPDKNAGDQKAARIMAIVNSAYATLSDAQRRREHDEWIAAEEWEIDWLESTQDEQRPGPATAVPLPARLPAWRHWTRWAALAACLGLGWLVGAWMPAQTWDLPAWGLSRPVRAAPGPGPAADAHGDAMSDSWAGAAPHVPAPDIRVLALSQVLLPGSAEDCRGAPSGALAPNGEAWPEQSGYVDGFAVGNKGQDLQLLIDNGMNATGVFVKLYDMDRHANVRYVFVRAHDRLSVDQLASGKYELRYQHINPAPSGCDGPGSG